MILESITAQDGIITEHVLIATTIRTLAIASTSIAAGTFLLRARPSARSLVWNSALLACLITSVAWRLAPSLTVFVPSRLLFAAAAPATLERVAPTPLPGINSKLDDAGAQPADRAVAGTGQMLLYIWLAGVVFFGIRFGRQVLCARRFARRATRFHHPRLEALLADARSSLGTRRDVAVLESSQIDIPLAAGIVHPVILVPVSASEWTDDELRIVLLHELAHVRRADVVARAVAMIACAIHWFNPLVWVLGALSTRDAELAADDLVLHAGVRPSTYADALLNLAGSVFNFSAAQPAMPLVRRAALSDRVHAILRDAERRTDIGPLTRIALVAGTCAIGLLAACVRFAPVATTNLRPVTLAAPIAAAAATADSSWIDNATEGLIKALADASPQVRGGAAHSLGRLRAERARRTLVGLTKDPDKYVRYEADQALAALDRTN